MDTLENAAAPKGLPENRENCAPEKNPPGDPVEAVAFEMWRWCMDEASRLGMIAPIRMPEWESAGSDYRDRWRLAARWHLKKITPKKEVWWESLNGVGKNAAVLEALGLSEGYLRNWVDQFGPAQDVATAFRLAHMEKVVGLSLWLCVDGRFRAEVGDGSRTVCGYHRNPAEALCVALLLLAGVEVHLEKKPLEANVDAGGGGL